MVEAGGQEISEDTLVEALELAHDAIKQICQLQIDLAARAGQPKWVDGAVTESLRSSQAEALQAAIREGGLAALQPKANAIFAQEAPEINGVLHRCRHGAPAPAGAVRAPAAGDRGPRRGRLPGGARRSSATRCGHCRMPSRTPRS